MRKIAPRGFEYLKANQQAVDNKALIENSNPVLSTSLDNLLQIYPDLTQFVKVWPELPEETKTAIRALVQTHNNQTKETKGIVYE